MDEDSTRTNRQIDAAEANRLAQGFNRQVSSDIPEYSGENPQADPDRTDDRVEAADRQSPLLDVEPQPYPPPVGRETEIGGTPEERQMLAEEERP